jgi:hypothetical protein
MVKKDFKNVPEEELNGAVDDGCYELGSGPQIFALPSPRQPSS